VGFRDVGCCDAAYPARFLGATSLPFASGNGANDDKWFAAGGTVTKSKTPAVRGATDATDDALSPPNASDATAIVTEP